MKTLFILLVVIAAIPFMGFAADTVTVWKESFDIYLDGQWSVTDKGDYNFRQFAFWIDWEWFDKRLTFPDFFAYQVPDGNGGNFSEFAVGIFYRPLTGKFTLNTGSYYMFSPDGMYILPAVNPRLDIWRFSAQVFFLQYVPLSEEGKDQSVIYPLDFYFRVGGPFNLQVGVWNAWYDAEGLEERQIRCGPSVIFENSFGKFRLHAHRRDPQGGWAFMVRQTFKL